MATRSAKVPKVLECVKCAGAMEEGVVVDRGPYGLPLHPLWFKGGMEFSFRTGLKTTSGRMRKVATWRCTACGFLEAYAN
jgi:hypothetical protein